MLSRLFDPWSLSRRCPNKSVVIHFLHLKTLIHSKGLLPAEASINDAEQSVKNMTNAKRMDVIYLLAMPSSRFPSGHISVMSHLSLLRGSRMVHSCYEEKKHRKEAACDESKFIF